MTPQAKRSAKTDWRSVFHGPAFLLMTAEERAASWARNPPRAMPMIPDAYAARQREMEALRKQASLAKLKRSVERNKGRRDALPKDFNSRDYRWDPRKCQFVPDELAYLSRPPSPLVEKVEPKVAPRPKPLANLKKRADGRVGLTLDKGRPSKDDLPERIKARYGMDVKALKKFAQANGVWEEKYLKLPNPGLVRMNVVNRLRAKARKGHVVKWGN